MRAAIIDIGSTTMKLAIGEQDGDDIKILESLVSTIDIGRDTFYQGRIARQEINQIIDILEKYRLIINQYEVTDVKVIATTAVREAENNNLFLDTIYRKTGYTIEILNVGDVVFYIDSYLSQKLKKFYPLHEKNLIIAEIGSGSLDISIMEKGYIVTNMGIPAGTLRLKQFKNQIDGTQEESDTALEEFIESQLSRIRFISPKIKIDDIILIDETYSKHLQNLLPKKSRASNFFQFSRREVNRLKEKVKNERLDEIGFQYKIPPHIADTLDGYAMILDRLLTLVKNKYCYILETSLSEAILGNLIFGREISAKYSKSLQLISAARFICQKFNSNLKHTKAVAKISEELFGYFKDILGLQEESLIYLILAAYMHNVGLFISNRAYHKHAEYIINSMQMFRLTQREMKMIACIARYHRKATPQRSHPLYASMDPHEQMLIQKLSSILRIAHSLDNSQKQKIKNMEVQYGKNQDISLILYTQDSFALEKSIFAQTKYLFEELSGSKINLIIKKIS